MSAEVQAAEEAARAVAALQQLQQAAKDTAIDNRLRIDDARNARVELYTWS